jgi:hypothetical protein
MHVGANTKTPPTLNFVSAFSQHSTTYKEATYAQTPIPRTYVHTKICGKRGGRAAATVAAAAVAALGQRSVVGSGGQRVGSAMEAGIAAAATATTVL